MQVDYAGKLCKLFASIKLLLAHELFASKHFDEREASI